MIAKEKRLWRTVQLMGLMLACVGLLGFALMTRQAGSGRPAFLAVSGEAPTFNVILAGLEASYCAWATPTAPARKCTPEEAIDPSKVLDGLHTDTIMLASFRGSNVDVLSIPRDTQVEGSGRKINSSFKAGGAELFQEDVENLVEQRVDYYALVRLDYVADVIDALGGLDVFAPADVDFHDRAADLHLTLSKGSHHLNGKDAVAFLRMRKAIGWGDDYGRIDRQKIAITQLLDKLKSPAGLAALPKILSGFASGVVTNLDPNLLTAMQPFLQSYRLNMTTLPTQESGYSSNLLVDRDALAEINSNSSTAATEPSSFKTRIVDASGVQALGEHLAYYLRTQGYQVDEVEVDEQDTEKSTVFTRNEISGAEMLAKRMNVARLQTLRQPVGYGEVVVYLGSDAATRFAALMSLNIE